MKTIILDTNFLMAITQGLDIMSEFQRICNFNFKLAIIDRTLDELETIPRSNLAKEFIKRFEIKIIKSQKRHVDDTIIDIVDENYVVATQDKGLKIRLKEKNVPIVIIRQKKYLEFEG